MKLKQNEISAIKDLLASAENRSNQTLEELHQKLSSGNAVDLYVDGAADLHSKTAGIGGVFYQEGDEIASFSEYYDDATNNEAEYSALIHGLHMAKEMNVASISIYSDSQLIVNQVNGEFRVKHENMIPLHAEATELLDDFDSWSLEYIPRDDNAVADKLCKAAMISGR